MPFSSYSCLKKTNRDMRSFFASSNCESIGAVLEFTGQYSSDYSVQFAVMALIAAPAVIVFVLLNKHITKGVAMGAVNNTGTQKISRHLPFLGMLGAFFIMVNPK